MLMIQAIHQHFKEDPYRFEECAAELWRMSAGNSVVELQVTRRSRDGGCDAIGKYALRPSGDRVMIDFAIEAKCYAPGGKSVGVREMARLISRLRHRQFGVMVTTSCVDEQTYKEIREDGHPIVVLSARDIHETLIKSGITTLALTEEWLQRFFA